MTFSIVQVSLDRERLLTAPVRHFIVCGILQERSLSGNNESLKVALVRTAMIRVANVAFLKPDLKILAFLNTFGFFGNQKKPDKIWLNLFWKESITMQGAHKIENILLLL